LTHVPLSKSSLHRLVNQYGKVVGEKLEEEASAMVRVPSKDEPVVWRTLPEPDSPIMNVSSDGVLIHIIDEGWKEVKIAAVSAVTATVEEESGTQQISLTQHSYRAGLWEAAKFAPHLWAESCRRGLEKAEAVVSVNDGAPWIWAIVWMCFAQCTQILDWWHAVERLWTIASCAFGADRVAATLWVKTQKELLAQSNLHQVLRNTRTLFPRAKPVPEAVLQAASYFRHNWRRMAYKDFRQAGYPIGSGTVESACKLVVQQRMKQSGMRWSRSGAQAMLALRSVLLSQRWSLLDDALPS
jgi:hypothetical protein